MEISCISILILAFANLLLLILLAALVAAISSAVFLFEVVTAASYVQNMSATLQKLKEQGWY